MGKQTQKKDAGKKGGKKEKKAPLPGTKGGKAKKKKWSKSKVKEKLNNACLLDKSTHDKLFREVPSWKLITPSLVSDRLRINGSLARQAIKELLARGQIKPVSTHHSQFIYTRAPAT